MNNSGRASVATASGRKIGQQCWIPEIRGSVCALELLLRDVLSHIQPSQEDREKRCEIITKITNVLKDLEPLKGASIRPFGSFVSDLYTRWGDLDISIELLDNGRQSSEVGKNKKKKILISIRQALIQKGVTRSVQLIPSARVPLLIFEDPYSNISCDISINNGSGLFKSKFLYWISQLDTRCRELVFLIKYWAKAHNINDPKTGTLNSFSLSLLVIFHLQTQSPPILPPVKDIYDGDIASDLSGRNGMAEIQIENKCIQNLQKFKQQGFGTKNKSTISDLFISFFAQYATVSEKCLQGLAVCTFTGKWGNAFSSECRIKKKYAMTIEDPFDRLENCARSVTESTLKIISDEFVRTNQALQVLHMLSEEALRQSLFGSPHLRPRPYVLPSLETYNPKMQWQPQPSTAISLDRLTAAFSQGCSLEERNSPRQSKVVSTSPSIYRHQAQPSFSYSASHHLQQEQFPSERNKQPYSTMDVTTPNPHGKIWKPKSGSRAFNH